MTRATRLLPALLLALALPAAAAEQRVFRDDFSDAASGWVDTQSADHTAKGIALYDGSGGYQMTPVDDSTYGIMVAPRQADGGDVRIDAALFLYTGVGQGMGGVVCRHQDNDNFYAFVASGNHGAGILKVKDGQATTLARASFDGAMRTAVSRWSAAATASSGLATRTMVTMNTARGRSSAVRPNTYSPLPSSSLRSSWRKPSGRSNCPPTVT